MLTKGAIGNLVNRYRAVLQKCNLINTFGSLAVASMLVLGGAGVAGAEDLTIKSDTKGGIANTSSTSYEKCLTTADGHEFTYGALVLNVAGNGIDQQGDKKLDGSASNQPTNGSGILNITADTIDINTITDGNGLLTQYNGELTLDVNKKITINAGGHGINSGSQNGKITINAKNAEVDITANENAIYVYKNSPSGEITIDAKKINVISTNLGEQDKNWKGYAVMSASNGGIVKLTAAEDITISSARTAVYANKGKIDVIGKTIAITAGEGAGVRAGTSSSNEIRGNGHVTLGNANTESITIDGTMDYGIIARAKDNNFKPENQSSVVVNGKSLVIGGKSDSEVGAGVCAASGTDKSYGDASSTITLNTDYTEITADYGIYNMSNGVVDVKGNLKIDAAKAAIITRGYAETYINEGNSKDITVNIKGDIEFNKFYDSDTVITNAKVVMNLNNADSVFDGNIIVTNSENVSASNLATAADIIDMHLGLANGAQWNSTANSFVNKLTMNDGVLNVKGTHTLNIGDLTGPGGTANMQATLNDDAKTAQSGYITVAKADDSASLAVSAMKEDGVLYTADEITVDQIKDVQSRITGVNTTAFAPEGDVMGALTIDKNGNASMAKNTLMDAALQQASVTTVALDKILTNDVRKRLGDIRSDKNTTGVWMRWDGGKLQGNGLSNDFNTIQIGGDTKVAKNCRLGVAGTFTHGDAEFARGTAELEGFTFAAYATWMGENGMFADVVARLGQFSNEMKVEGRTGDMDNRVFSLSGEYGWRLPVCDQFFIEPQVELAYTYVSSDELELGTSKYAFDNVNSLTGRAGVVFGWNLPDDRGNVYARASVLQQFMGDAKITGTKGIAHNVQEIDGNDTWLEYGIGANVKLSEKTYVWADVERTAGADLDEEWRGTIGFRYSF